MIAATLDAHENWRDAAWVPVRQNGKRAADLKEKDAVDVCFDPETMQKVGAGRTVLFDGDKASPSYGLVLAFYHAGGEPELGEQLRTHFEVLAARDSTAFNAKRENGWLPNRPQRMEHVGFHKDSHQYTYLLT